MVQKTAKLGGTASDVVVARAGVRIRSVFGVPMSQLHRTHGSHSFYIAWTHDDDVRLVAFKLSSSQWLNSPPVAPSHFYSRTLHPISDEQAFEAIKAGIDDLLPNTKMILNSGMSASPIPNHSVDVVPPMHPILTLAEFYGVNPETYNLQLLSRFFEKYPSYTDKAFLCVKGGLKAGAPTADSSSVPSSILSLSNFQ